MEELERKKNKSPLLKPNKTVLKGIGEGLLHNLPGMAFRCKNDSRWSMLFISEGCIDLTGYSVVELIDNALLSYADLVFEDDRQHVRKAINESVVLRTQYQTEYRITCKNGTVKWVWEKGNAVYDRDHNPAFLDGFIVDASARRSAEDKLQQTAHDLAELNITKDRFFSLMAHDLQNPVYAIISLSEFLAENYDNFNRSEIEDALLQVNSAARGIFTLLENLLDWARLQTGQMSVQKEFISLKKTIEYAIEHYRKPSIKKGIEIVFEHEEDCLVEGDLRMLTSVFRNLISNALKYSHPHSKILIQLKNDSPHICVSVTDNGTGIPRRHLQKIFKLDNEYRQYGTANESGSGLGLILVDNFVKLLGAEIQVESKLNHGSKFTLIMPARI